MGRCYNKTVMRGRLGGTNMREKVKNCILNHKKRICCISAIALFLIVAAIGAVNLYGSSVETKQMQQTKAVSDKSKESGADAAKLKVDESNADKSKADKSKVENKKKADSTEKKENSSSDQQTVKEASKEAKSKAVSNTEPKAETVSASSQEKSVVPETTPEASPEQSQAQTGGEQSSSNENSSVDTNNTESSSKPEQNKVWHDPVYENKWVVDQPAWTEEVPIYGTKEVMICSTCGAEITGFAGEHLDETMHGGYYADFPQVQVGINSVTHPEQGHYEQVLVKEGYWD